MPIIATEESRVLVQGITGSEGTFRTKRMLDYGTSIIAGSSPGRGGRLVHGIPVYDSVLEAVDEHPQINSIVQFVPARFVRDAALEAVEAEVPYLIIIAEGVPFQDMMAVTRAAGERDVTVVGPNTPGVISPGVCELGATAHCVFHGPGKIGVISTAGSIQWYMSRLISLRGWGQSTFVGVGGDPIRGLDIPEALSMFEGDDETEAILMVGEIGGDSEIRAAELIKSGCVSKPVVAYLYGRTAPPGRRMGHAGAIIERGVGDVKTKAEALKDAGVKVLTYPWEVLGAFEEYELEPIPDLLKTVIREAKIGR